MANVSNFILNQDQIDRGWLAEEDEDLLILWKSGQMALVFSSKSADRELVQTSIEAYEKGFRDAWRSKQTKGAHSSSVQ
jgi:hypothetical protein